MRPVLFVSLTLISLLFLSITPAFSAEQYDPIASGLKMMWGLGIVLAILFAVSFLVKKNLKGIQKHDQGIIKIIETKHVMPKKSLLLIEVRDQEYLVGCGNDGINTIVPVTKKEPFSDLLKESEEILSHEQP